ncbi:7,8-Dihydro-6-hydroxymethylpterin-pyrophosphokinase, HPPK domain protein [Candidatus Omnitrophus magneticus]|uniref:2-amino-4-hydroxy-6-hydroxymethyldihydropteridine pyrophosphokinase n=1 Tax=Candidatus Omnitrophus magneticus TaxID=1609969 RepID=A0A0F0CUF9_9BACT|nr:7,8-Dihydro-6-hydroxymethylpterin-pyrophosphokinase, HPPK domain protein [Candidatus Omnitrophus magneticus]
MAIVYLGIGSNIGDATKNCESAVQKIKFTPNIQIIKSSSFYKTKHVGGPAQEDYINGVIKIKTDLSPESCLVSFKALEKEMGRIPAPRNYPRVIDIDILFYDDIIFNNENLVIPHPLAHERLFILKGLNEIEPYFVHPVIKKTISKLYAEALVTKL